jgi:hypothetical protein
MHTPGLIALGTGIRDKPTLFMEAKYLDTRYRGIENPFGMIGTRHLTL